MDDEVEPGAGRHYWLVRLGAGVQFADELIGSGSIAVDFVGSVDLTSYRDLDVREFHAAIDPIFRGVEPEARNITVGLAVGNLRVVVSGISVGDVVLSPLGNGRFRTGTVTGEYGYFPGTHSPHRRPVAWDAEVVAKEAMSDSLRRGVGGPMTVYSLDGYASDIDLLRAAHESLQVVAEAERIETALAFRLEKQLEDFMVENWQATPFATDHRIAEAGQQYPTDGGRIDILAERLDGTGWLVLELKRGRAGDEVVGQVLRYMGFVRRVVAAPDQEVRGVIVALDDDQKVRDALSMTTGVEFFTFQVRFELERR